MFLEGVAEHQSIQEDTTGNITSSYGFDTLIYEYTQTGKLVVVLIEEDYRVNNNPKWGISRG